MARGAAASRPPPPRSPPTSLPRRLPGGRDLSGCDARGEEEPAGWPPSRDDARTLSRPEPAHSRQQAHGPARVSGSDGRGAASGPAMSPLFSWVAKVGGGGLELPGASNCRTAARGEAVSRPFERAPSYFSFIPPLSRRASLPEGVAPVPRLGRLRHNPSPRCSPRLWDRLCCPGSSLLGAAGVGRRACCLALGF